MSYLTDKQSEVMRLVAEGLTAKEIGASLGLSFKTVESHIDSAIKSLGAKNRTHAAVLLERWKADEATKSAERAQANATLLWNLTKDTGVRP